MRAQHADDLLHRFDSRTHRLPTPVIEKLAGPSWGIFGGNLRADHLNSGRLPPDVPAESKKFRASRALLRRYSNTSPCHSFVPLLLTRIIWLPIAIPYSALKALVTTLYLRIPSTPSVVPASEAVDAPCSFTINAPRSEEHTSELQSLTNLVCRLLLEKKNKQTNKHINYHKT